MFVVHTALFVLTGSHDVIRKYVSDESPAFVTCRLYLGSVVRRFLGRCYRVIHTLEVYDLISDKDLS